MIRNIWLGDNGFEYETSCDWCDNTGPYYDYNGASLCEECLWREIDSQEDEIDFLLLNYPEHPIADGKTIVDILREESEDKYTKAIAAAVKEDIEEYYAWRETNE